jgi:phage antirepressor YoqD-like protein
MRVILSRETAKNLKFRQSRFFAVLRRLRMTRISDFWFLISDF